MPYITEERRMIQEQAREFTLNEVLPVANKLDPEKGDIPMDLREKMAELGYFGILIPEQYGGLGLGCFEYCLVTEELSRGWMSVASLIARGNLLIGSQEMSEEQRARYLPRMANGSFLGVNELTFHQPVYPGDSLSAESIVLDRRTSDSHKGFGIVTWHTKGFNQREELAIDFKRTNLVRLRNA